MFVIFDLDGTLADVDHRRHLMNGNAESYDVRHL